jgi:hypothetical protein
VAFGDGELIERRGGASIYGELHVPGVTSVMGDPGTPAVPVLHKIIAVPTGAVVTAKATPHVRRTVTTSLYPIQPQPADQIVRRGDGLPQIGIEPPFTRLVDIYLRDALVPSSPVTVRQMGTARGMSLFQLSIATGQYNPARKQLTLFSSVDIDLTFEGGRGTFLPSRSLGMFEEASSLTLGSVLNSAAAKLNADLLGSLTLDQGAEFLILTPPSLRAAADKLAEWKNSKGIITQVHEVCDGAGPGPDTKEAIDALIEDHFDHGAIRVSYVLLLGDTQLIPTFYVYTGGSATTGSDYQYAVYGSMAGSPLPSFAVGRIPADNLTQANTVVDKIINYEKNPPTDRNFYANATVVSQFQCCRDDVSNPGTDWRTFVEASEFARNVMMNHGKTVQRIYTMTGSGTPRRYYDGTLLPSDLAPGSGFGWNGTGSQITDAFNAGRFLIMHRDHGGPDEWSHPGYYTSNLGSVHNGALLPVVFSVNCASGFFDNETAGGDYGTTPDQTYLVESLVLKSDGGAVGALGDSRNSPSWPNSALARGFFDAIWHDALPGFGDNSDHRRLGDILNHGKYYLMTQIPVASAGVYSGDARDELYLWHCFGDPTLEIRTSAPPVSIGTATTTLSGRVLQVAYAVEGALVTAVQDTPSGLRVIGRGEVINGLATIDPLQEAVEGTPIRLIVNGADLISRSLAGRITLRPIALSGLTLDPASLMGGNSGTGKVTLSGAAPKAGATVTLSVDDASVVDLPDSVTVAPGATSATFTYSTSKLTETATVTITASLGSATKAAPLKVTPPLILPITLVTLKGLTLSAKESRDLAPVTGTVEISRTLITRVGTTIALKAEPAGLVSIPSSLTVSGVATKGSFTITPLGAVDVDTRVTITASLGRAQSQQATLTLVGSPVVSLGALTIQDVSGAPGGIVTVNVVAGQGLVGIKEAQMTLAFPSDVAGFPVGVALPVELPDNLIPGATAQATPGVGQVTITVQGTQPSTAEGRLLSYRLLISATAPEGTYPLEFASLALTGTGGTTLITRAVEGKLTVAKPRRPGDVDGDGKTTISDVVLALRIVLGLVQPTDAQLKGADMTGDGKITIADALKILRLVSGIDRVAA